MFDERAFISQVEAASPEELAQILTRPTLEEEKALRAHLGDDRYQRMHGMALMRKVTRGLDAKSKGNVIVIHGIMGAELSVGSGGAGDLTWVNAFRILRGWLDRLRLSDDGRSEANPAFTVRASGIMKRFYGEMLLSLSAKWNVKAFWFDWRKDLDLAANELNARIGEWFAADAPVHIVAHSMGGLVARSFIKTYGDRWKTMKGRLVMLGTPNQGSFAIPQVITGLEGMVRKLAMLDLRHSAHDLLSTFNSFVGSYQMMPSHLAMPTMERLYDAGTFTKFNVSVPQAHLKNAEAHHEWLRDVIDPSRMIYIAGFDQPTFCDIADWDKLDQTDGYLLTQDGDGRVPHSLGLLEGVPRYYINESHGNLSTNATILGVLDELLTKGETDGLPTEMPERRAAAPSQVDLRAQFDADQAADAARLQLSLRRMSVRGVRSESDSEGRVTTDPALDPGAMLVSPEERKVEEAITRGFMAYRGDEESTAGSAAEDQFEITEVEIGLVHGGIESIDYDAIRSAIARRDSGVSDDPARKGYPIDAIAVGHYIGVQPQYAELKLDEAISAALLGVKYEPNNPPPRSELVLTQYTERGIIHGRLGQPFIIPDPRAATGDEATRLIAIAGMNEPGRFGVPELTVLARELCWSLGRLNKFHLATVLIGSGEGNLSLRDAVAGWLTGIKRAVYGSKFDSKRRLQCITFVDNDARRVIRLDYLIKREQASNEQVGFKIIYRALSDEELKQLKEKAFAAAQQELKKKWKNLDIPPEEEQPNDVPTRVTLSLDTDKKVYRFGAITDTASVPERETVIDPKLVWQANDELAGEQKPSMQLERGRFLEELLIPADLRNKLYGKAPLVMMLDSTTARIHWEMVAQPALGGAAGGPAANITPGKFEYEDNFLGTCRSLTRQLRTTFAPAPEPPPPPQRVLRVLVVADPAPDAHLPGAQEEGVVVADLFESYNVVKRATQSTTRVEVKRLFGPIEATRTNVLRELIVRHYDVLHFAGHCVFEWDGNPNRSGWIFNLAGKELLSADELRRVDRIPKFVFSNACESGITPDRSQERSDRLAPSFAEAFFERGVANFVCTAWPVDDLAARTFALTLYSSLLGIDVDANTGRSLNSGTGAQPMHEAMQKARLAIARTPNGRTTWGCYQHYGNPYFRLFDEGSKEQPQATGEAEDSGEADAPDEQKTKVG
jgi:hypothetical protein